MVITCVQHTPHPRLPRRARPPPQTPTLIDRCHTLIGLTQEPRPTTHTLNQHSTHINHILTVPSSNTITIWVTARIVDLATIRADITNDHLITGIDYPKTANSINNHTVIDTVLNTITNILVDLATIRADITNDNLITGIDYPKTANSINNHTVIDTVLNAIANILVHQTFI